MFLAQKWLLKKHKKFRTPDPPPPNLGLSPKFYQFFWPRPLTKWTFKICNIYSQVLSATDPRADQVVIQSKDSARWPGIAPASQDTRLHNVHNLCQRLSTYSSPGSQLHWVCSISWLPKRWDHDLKLFPRLAKQNNVKGVCDGPWTCECGPGWKGLLCDQVFPIFSIISLLQEI